VVKWTNPRAEAFVKDATARLPRALYAFNIADFKRRNMHLGHTVGDEDVREIDRMLRALPDALVARTSGDHWFVLMRPGEAARAAIVAIIDAFTRVEPVTMGWEARGTKDGVSKSRREVIGAELSRAVRCVYADVATHEELADAAARIEQDNWALPVGRLVALSEIPSLERRGWQCVSRYPEETPACAFCEHRAFDSDEGDGHVYSSGGACKKCGAKISIHDAFERGSEGDQIAHYRISIVHENGKRVLVTRLARAVGADDPSLHERAPWDLPLVELRAREAGDDRSVLVESLARGSPSSRFLPRKRVPPFVHAIAEQFVRESDAGRAVGELHPTLIFVDPNGELVACAQRPLRAERGRGTTDGAKAVTDCGMAPMFFAPILTPKEVRGYPDVGASADAFRLANLVWRWRRGRSPFGADFAALIAITNGTPTHAPADDLDRLLVRAFAPDEKSRASAADIASALRSFSGGFSLRDV
jgi:GGDEF domain-containing protein